MDEAQLIAAAQGGDEDAFAELYRHYHKYVRAIGRSILRTDDLDDMCQETFLSAFTRLGGFEGQAQFKTWLSRIALNRCLLILRDEKRPGQHGMHEVVFDEEVQMRGLQSVDARLEGLPGSLDMERFLKRLTIPQREALEMAYLGDMSAQEIAADLNTTVAAVKGRLAIAKKKMKIMREQ
jgi:RNA polymerase sigma-70 factor, ECF subfamily